MDKPNTESVKYVDNIFLPVLYGFLALLGVCMLFSLVKAIYHFYKVRVELNTENCEQNERHSISNDPSTLDRQLGSNISDSDRLRVQLDKLRRLLNRLNAMGTFSRDTIGDLSEQTVPYGNYSRAASSDASAFWSSIDFDDCEESIINGGKFGTTLTEKSVSPSVSDFSLDASDLNFDNLHEKKFATSSAENVLNAASQYKQETNPSDTIFQILAILDSIRLRNRRDRPLDNKIEFKRNSDESINVQALSGSSHSMETYVINVMPTLSSSELMDKTSSISMNSKTLINTPVHTKVEIKNSEANQKDNEITYKHKSLDEISYIVQSSISSVTADEKLPNGANVINIGKPENLYATKLSSSNKSLDSKLSVPRSVGFYMNKISYLLTQARSISDSTDLSRKFHLNEKKNLKDIISKPHAATEAEISPYIVNLEAINRSHSLSDLIEKRPIVLSIPCGISKSFYFEKKAAIAKLNFENKSQVAVTLESTRDLQKFQPKNYEKTDKTNETSNSKSQVGNKQLSFNSSGDLQVPSFSDAVTLKLSLSESDIKPSQCLGILSPDLSPSSSDAFLSPVVATDISPSEKVDWKSPVELISDSCVSSNLTPHNENVTVSRKSCMWSTPPSPSENVS